MIEIGHIAAILALALSLAGILLPILGTRWDPAYLRVGRLSLYLVTALLMFACGTIINAFLKSDFSVLYVAMNSNSRLPTFYKVAALWGGHEGSLLLWSTLLSIFASLVVTFHWKSDPDFMPSVMGIFASIQASFLSLVLFLSSPFERLFPAAMEGRDLNPLLQDPQMVIHPPTLFSGYTAFAVPFAFALTVLITGRGADRWIFIARRWILLAWVILTAGIALGGHWAYRELGWGGYWAWDPVENASLMPWLIGTALLHSVMVQEQRKTFRVWNVGLAITAFALSILGTFLVRSGIISSVHAFASDPSRGLFLLGFFFTVLMVSFGLLVIKANKLTSAGSEIGTGLSRETLFLFNNLFFVVCMLTVFLGTLFPLGSELIAGTKVTVAAPFFNQTFIPIMAFNLLLMAVAPMLPWRKFTWAQVLRISKKPIVLAVIAAVALPLAGVRKPITVVSMVFVAYGLGVIIQDFFSAAWSRSKGNVGQFFPAFFRLFQANRRRYGGLTAHLGMLVLAIGFAGSYAYQTEADVSLKQGERTKIGNYDILYNGLKQITGPNYSGMAGDFEVSKNGEIVTHLNPEKRFYLRSSMPTTEPQRLKAWTHELYVTLGDVDEANGIALVKIYLNPLVQCVWAGIIMLILGGLLSLSYRVRLRRDV